MGIIQAAILGLVQGLTEFLPVSSSGHLVLLERLFGITEGQGFFAVMVHIGTLAAVCIALRQEIAAIFKQPAKQVIRYLFILGVATVPLIIAALLFKDFIDSMNDGRFLGFAFILTGVILTIGETISTNKSKSKKSEVTFGSALIAGIMQAVAVFPGVSRSGTTITGSLFAGLDRKSCANFAFLMSIPAILGSLVYEGYSTLKSGFDAIDWMPVMVGVAVSLISGFIAVKFMLNLIAKKKLYGFAIYTLALGIIILAVQIAGFGKIFPSVF